MISPLNYITRIKQGKSAEDTNFTDIAVFLHGYGADASNILPIWQFFADSFEHPLFVFPNAPEVFEFGPPGFQWYSLIDRSREALLDGSRRACEKLDDFLSYLTQKYSIAEQKITLIGFSQGTMTSIFTAIRRAKPIRAIVGYSGTLIAPDLIEAEAKSKMPICLIHGDEDLVVPIALSKITQKYLTDAGYKCDFHKIEGLEHSISDKGIKIAKAFLRGQN